MSNASSPSETSDAACRVGKDAAASFRHGKFHDIWSFPWRSVSGKLIALLMVTMLVTFGVLGWLNIRLHRKHLEATTLAAADQMGDVIKRSTSYYMMRNDRYALYEMMSTMADEPGVERLRIINQEGRISFSTDPVEVSTQVDKSAEACYACHTQAQPLTRLDRPDRFRIYRGNNERVMAIITPIENEPACSNAACHAHPASQRILGVLDTHHSLAKADAGVAEGSRMMLLYTAVAMCLIAGLSWLFVLKVVHEPLGQLRRGTERLAKGELGHQIEVGSKDEVGILASSFNDMSKQLLDSRQEVTAWARTLEDRVEQKTSELRRAHDQMLQVEKMVAIGKMAAVVAHEINNPLSGILTYAKLMKKWITRGVTTAEKKKEVNDCLDLVASESRRCGDLVRNLLTFSRTSPMNLGKSDLSLIVDRVVRLVQHKVEMTAIQFEVTVAEKLPLVYCDAAQIEQVLLALVMNAIDAMPHGGNLWLAARLLPSNEVQLEVRDDGMGIPPELLSKLFEPFNTTKDVGKGVGLGLAISKGIVDRHGGRIDVESVLGHGTTFRIVLPIEPASAPIAKHADMALKN
ncbi:MAG TPA: ATP-binding protein [Clostridia bacterium]|nr:ATP-binding protein [Clostridia bacterium]